MRQASPILRFTKSVSAQEKLWPALLFFHHAGGSALSFAPLAKALRGYCEFCIVELPGRGRSHKEPFATTLSEFAQSLEPEITQWLSALGRPAIFVGHSMGALLAFEAICALTSQLPAKLVVSACAAPGSRQGPPGFEKSSHSWSEAELLQMLTTYGPLPGLLESPSARSYFLPIFASDLQLIQRYLPGRKKIAVPIHAVAAEEDAVVSESETALWKEYTERRFTKETVAGGHFYPLQSLPTATQIIKKILSAVEHGE